MAGAAGMVLSISSAAWWGSRRSRGVRRPHHRERPCRGHRDRGPSERPYLIFANHRAPGRRKGWQTLILPTTLLARAVLFDLDGTLVDSSASLDRIWSAWAERVEVEPDDVRKVHPGRRPAYVVQHFIPDLDEAEAARTADIVHAQLVDTDGIIPMPGAIELLEALPRSAWAIVTASTRQITVARLDAAGLPVPNVVVADDEVERGKPHPDGYLRGAELLGLPTSDVIVVEDAPAGITAGRAAGMVVVAVATAHPVAELKEATVVTGDLTSITVEAVEAEGLTITIKSREPR